MRLFVALELPDSAKEELERTIQRLAASGMAPVRWVRPEGIHLTLKFLGEVPEERLDALQSRLAAAIPFPFDLEVGLGPVGTFGGPARTRVVWVGLTGDTGVISQLARAVDRAMADLGFPSEQRPFQPHLTLGRIPDLANVEDRRRIHALAAGAQPPDPINMRFNRMSLMRSILGKGGARYERLSTFPPEETV